MAVMNIISLLLLSAGILIVFLSISAIVFLPSTFARLHYLGPASTVGIILITLAVLIQEGFNSVGIKSIILASFIIISAPVLTHSTSRAKRIRTYGVWQQIKRRRKK